MVIATRNRREEVLRAVGSAWGQTAHVEVTVYDDASTDGTAQAVTERFPATRVVRRERRVGYIALRNQGAREASAPFFTSFDDDSELISPETFAHALREFDHPRIAAVALPTIDLGREHLLRNRAPDTDGCYVADVYPGAAAVLARAPFLALGGYREQLQHHGEELDYAHRLYAHGMVIRLSTAAEVHHHVSPRRSYKRDVRGHARAHLMVRAWAMPSATLLAGAALGLAYGVYHRETAAALRGLADGAWLSWRWRALREPLSPGLVALARRLHWERVRQSQRTRLEDIEHLLPPCPTFDRPSTTAQYGSQPRTPHDHD